MKRILFVCCLLTAACTFTCHTQSYAQAAPAMPTVSKPDLIAKTAQLKTLLDAGDAVGGKAKWDEIHKILMSALSLTKYNIKSAVEAHNDVAKAHYTDVMINQRNIYASLIQMRDNLVANKDAVNAKLTEFTATID